MQERQPDLFGVKEPDGGYLLYGGIPPFVDCDTSKEAAEKILPKAGSLQRLVLGVVRSRRPLGATCDEVEDVLKGLHQTISARVRELVQLGFIKDSGRRRTTRSGRKARVYIEE